MAILHSALDPAGSDFASNATAMEAAIAGFRHYENLTAERAERARPRFDQRGQLLPRERLGLLLDPGAPFLELSSLAGLLMHDDPDGSAAGGGYIAGIGFVHGRRVLAVANNSAVKGGTITPAGLWKWLRLQAIAMENRLPVITLAESGGANLNHVTEIFVDGARGFANQARLSAAGIPQITVVHGNATAGGAYQPGLSDYVIVVRGQSKIFLAGPPLVRAATGEVADDESLGGAELHAGETGTAEYLAENDAHGIHTARQVMARLAWPEAGVQGAAAVPPARDTAELLGVVPADPREPYDCREILARVVDGSEFLDFKASYDSQTICGHASICGHHVGIVGNNGPITPKGANKAAQFVQLCDQAGLPLVFLHNTTGFMVGTRAEQDGIVKHGSRLIQAVANARVPRIAVHVGGSYGAGNYAMCGRGLDPRFVFAWPNCRTAVMGGAQAGMVLRIVAEAKARRAGIEPDAAELESLQKNTAERLDAGSTALFGTARLWDDGLIDPRDTRHVLAFALDTCRDAERAAPRPNTFGVTRF